MQVLQNEVKALFLEGCGERKKKGVVGKEGKGDLHAREDRDKYREDHTVPCREKEKEGKGRCNRE